MSLGTIQTSDGKTFNIPVPQGSFRVGDSGIIYSDIGVPGKALAVKYAFTQDAVVEPTKPKEDTDIPKKFDHQYP